MKATTVVKPISAYRRQPRAESERELRRQLAAAYRIFDHFGWTHLIYGHITMRVPGPEKHFLINPFGLRYDEVTASNLVKIDLAGNEVEPSEYPVNPAGFIIHSAIHAAREDAHCVMHTHTVAGMALAASHEGLKRLDFAGCGLHGRVAYHAFKGVHADDSDREDLVKDLGDKHHMVLLNHGLLACGPTIASAFRRLHNLETACRVQCMAQAMNVTHEVVSLDIAEQHARILEDGDDGELAFAAYYRLMEKKDPSFLD
jgi:ribulose-5-phosphate 4-epimerase/fuculose-1-phosphate aldolase